MSKQFIAEVFIERNRLLSDNGKISHPELKNLVGSIVRVEVTYLREAQK